MVTELTNEDQVRLSELAAYTKRTEAELAREAMRWFLRPIVSHDEMITRARRDAREGRTVAHDELFGQIGNLLGE